MKFIVFSSGSKANCSALITKEGIILVDCGISFAKLKKAMFVNSLNIEDISHCIITHEHSDHVKGVKTLAKNYPNICFCLTKGTQLAYEEKFMYNIPKVKTIDPDSHLIIHDFDIEVFPTMHDARESIGFSIKHDNKKFSYLTDCGRLTSHIVEKLENTTHLAIESNYCPQMLENGKYPEFLKERIAGVRGHFSNNQASEVLQMFNSSLEYVCLMHLSEQNNSPTSAINYCKKSLKKDAILCVASQNNGAKIINF